MASSLDDMPDYERFQSNLDELLEQFLTKKDKQDCIHFHFFIEFLTFHCHFTNIKDINPDIIKIFIGWFEKKTNNLHINDLLEKDLNEFLNFSYLKTN